MIVRMIVNLIIPGHILNHKAKNNKILLSILDFEIIQGGLVGILRRQAGVG